MTESFSRPLAHHSSDANTAAAARGQGQQKQQHHERPTSSFRYILLLLFPLSPADNQPPPTIYNIDVLQVKWTVYAN